jgi:hypothetical protein
MTGKRHKPFDVDNPAFEPERPESGVNERRIRAVVNLRQSATASLAAYGILDKTQIAAANRFGAYWEIAHGLRLSANVLREHVDTGRRGSSAPERQIAAADELSRAHAILGDHGFRLVSQICGQGFAIREIYASRRQRDTATDMLRIHLDSLATMWRLAVYRG